MSFVFTESIDPLVLTRYLLGKQRLCDAAELCEHFVDSVVYYDLPAGGLNDKKDFMLVYKYLKKSSPYIPISTAMNIYRKLVNK